MRHKGAGGWGMRKQRGVGGEWRNNSIWQRAEMRKSCRVVWLRGEWGGLRNKDYEMASHTLPEAQLCPSHPALCVSLTHNPQTYIIQWSAGRCYSEKRSGVEWEGKYHSHCRRHATPSSLCDVDSSRCDWLLSRRLSCVSVGCSYVGRDGTIFFCLAHILRVRRWIKEWAYCHSIHHCFWNSNRYFSMYILNFMNISWK